MGRRFTGMAWLAASLMLPLGAPALGQSMSVSPSLVEVDGRRTSSAVTVQNLSDHPMAVQVRGFDWQQTNGEDTLTETARLTVSPPLATIAAGSTQTFRILLAPGPRTQEQSFRLIFDQLPDLDGAAAMAMRFRLSVPVFAKGMTTDQSPAQIEWRQEGGRLFATNLGGRHGRFRSLTLASLDGAQQWQLPLGKTPYLLSGTQRSWPVAESMPAGWRLSGMTDQGPIDVMVARTPAP